MSAIACHRPTTLNEALTLLATNPDARPLAGGQTLVAMLNLGLIEPTALVSLAAVRALAGIERGADGTVRIGAMTTHATIAATDVFAAGQTLLAQAARTIADPAIRNVGTIGGACAHGDPVADWPVALVAADARIELARAGATRQVDAQDFFRDLLTTDLQPGELITAIVVPPLPGRARYRKLARVHGDYATASVALVADGTTDHVRSVRIGIGACGPRPVRVTAAEALVCGQRFDAALARRAGELLAAAIDPIDDVRGSAAYRRRILPALLADTLMEALQP